MVTFNKKDYQIRTDLVHKANAIREVNSNTIIRLNDLAFELKNYEYFKVKINGTTYIYYKNPQGLFGITNNKL